MTRTETRRRLAWVAGMTLAVVLVVVGYLLLEPRAPGNAAGGFLTGGLTTLVALAAARWWHARRGVEAGSTARWAAGVPDERDDRILTRALAVVGYVAILGSAIGAALVLGGAPADVVATALPMLLLATLAVASVVIARRS